jgi:phage protein D
MADENKNLTPVWIAYVDGKRLSTDYEGALRKIYINDRLDFIGTASLLFDISAVDFDNDDVFVLGSEVSIHLGYKDDVEEVFVGEVTEFAPRFEEYNAPSMEVKIQTKLNELKKGHKCKSFENKTPASIIKDIVSKYDLTPDVEDFGPENIYTEQYNLTDYDYITYFADKYGKFIYCYNNTVYVKTEISPTNDDVVLEWGKTLIKARTEIDIKKQLSAVTATGWDVMKCEGFTATATMKDVPLKIGGEYCWEDNSRGYDPHKVTQLNSADFTDEAEAMEIAKAVILKRSLNFQTCEAKTEGNYHIRPGNRITVKYLGKESDGEYLVSSVEHTFNVQEGYFTTCHLKRNFCEISNKSGNVSSIDKERAENQTAQSESKVISTGGGSQTDEQNNSEETNEKEKNPAISNPHWEDVNGQTITKALVGDEVYLCADVTDIDDGATAKIKIIEKDDDGNNDDIESVSGKVQDSKIKCKWKVKYTADDDDTESQKEMDEKGYTLPEYAFTVECDGVESDESGQLDVMGWIRNQFVNKYNQMPIKNMNFIIKSYNGQELHGKTDENGYINIENIDFTKYKIIFKDNE